MTVLSQKAPWPQTPSLAGSEMYLLFFYSFFLYPWGNEGHSAVHSTFPWKYLWGSYSQWQCHHSYHQSPECHWAVPVLPSREALERQWHIMTCCKGSLMRVHETDVFTWEIKNKIHKQNCFSAVIVKQVKKNGLCKAERHWK